MSEFPSLTLYSTGSHGRWTEPRRALRVDSVAQARALYHGATEAVLRDREFKRRRCFAQKIPVGISASKQCFISKGVHRGTILKAEGKTSLIVRLLR